MLPIQNYMVLNGDISSQQITCGLTYLKGHVQHRSRHSTAHAKLTSRTDIEPTLQMYKQTCSISEAIYIALFFFKG